MENFIAIAILVDKRDFNKKFKLSLVWSEDGDKLYLWDRIAAIKAELQMSVNDTSKWDNLAGYKCVNEDDASKVMHIAAMEEAATRSFQEWSQTYKIKANKAQEPAPVPPEYMEIVNK